MPTDVFIDGDPRPPNIPDRGRGTDGGNLLGRQRSPSLVSDGVPVHTPVSAPERLLQTGRGRRGWTGGTSDFGSS